MMFSETDVKKTILVKDLIQYNKIRGQLPPNLFISLDVRKSLILRP